MRCCICKKKFIGTGNDPYPLCDFLDTRSRCCDECNKEVVKARINIAFGGARNNERARSSSKKS